MVEYKARVTLAPVPSIAGAPVFRGTRTQLLDSLDSLRSTGAVELVITPNVDQVLDLETDADWRDVFASASVRVVDGTPLLWLFKALGARDVAKHSGADLLPDVAALADNRGWTVAITGGADDVLAAGVERLSSLHPNATFVGVPFPRISHVADEASTAVVDTLKSARPDIVFVCLGAPKQEKWVHHWASALPAAVYIGAGAAIDFAAGAKTRAPRVAQRAGVEWLWRVAQEPRRLAKRYFGKGPRFIFVAARSLGGRRRQVSES